MNPRMHWWGEEPFPWLLAGGFAALVVAGWGAAWVFTTQFFDLKPMGVN